MAKRIVVKGTENIANHYGVKGVNYYGLTSFNGQRAIKIADSDVRKVEALGFREVGRGTAYAYVTHPRIDRVKLYSYVTRFP